MEAGRERNRDGRGRGGRGGYRGGYRGRGGRGGRGGGGEERGGGEGRGRGGGAGRGGERGANYNRGNDRREPDNDDRDQNGDARGNQNRGQRKVYPLGYRALASLLEKDPYEAAVELGSLKRGLEKLLEEETIRYDVISLLCQVLNHVCESQGAEQTVIMLLDMLGRSKFLTKHLCMHLIKMRTERERNRLSMMPRCIQDIARVLSEIQQRLPTHCSDVAVAAMLLGDAVKYTEQRNIVIEDRIKEMVNNLIEYQAKIEQERERKHQRYEEPTLPPPDDFRELSVFPTSDELTDSSHRTYLRKHKAKGQYEDVDHYLDVQFRLLREDFVLPLREGIIEYRRQVARPGGRNKKLQDIRLYHDVTLDEPLYSQSGVLFRIHFDETKFKNVRWESSKRLIYGSLVILSPDDFKTLIFGTVANRKPDDLKKGFIEIRLERDEEVVEIFSDKSFLMAESSAYFEAYRHVLSCLQQVTEQTMPLTDYLVSASSKVKPPVYLRHDRSVEYDLSTLVCPDVPNERQTKTLLKHVRILDDCVWGKLGNTGLDDSQIQAVRAALTQEMTVIQGPPGTGKTYVGLKVVHTLLQNKQVWKEAEAPVVGRAGTRSNKPILLVCYTNHALDQFLEGVAEYTSEGIVRVGGRSSSEALKRFNLNTLRSSKLREEVPRHVRRRIGEVRGEIETLGKEVKVSQDRINRTRKGILHEMALEECMTADHFDSLTFGNRSTLGGQSILVNWLLGDMLFEGPDVDVPEEPAGNQEDEEEEEEQIDILEEADLLEELRRLDIDDHTSKLILGDAGADLDDGTLAFRVEDLENVNREAGWQHDRRNLRRRKADLERNLRSTNRMTDEEARNVGNVWVIDKNSRWKLYRYWIYKHRQEANRRLVEMQRQFTNVCQELREARTQEDFEIMRHATVIGMTTTGAAKFHMLLQRIQPRIVVVEEAAEVLEAHIVTALTQSCQHLILIGDHQQLRPNPTVYKLATRYHLDISLFERMINNEFPYQTLGLQHRMRPEISCLMRIKLYPKLRDHGSVHKYENIKGVRSNLFFIHHEEKENSEDEMKSHSNLHEATFMVALCKYFLQQGYLPEQITVLTTYAGQLFAFKRRMKRIDFQGVRVATVDNFQGEENDIILLSLVRSNTEGSAGFLKIDNRVCVALSRAKKGLFCIGNFKLLAAQDQNGSSLWREIVKHCEATKNIGRGLTLQCENHPETNTVVANDKDFAKVPEGGCTKPCEARLSCGHVCRMPCHPTDRNHENYKCQQPCTKVICSQGHRCGQRCYMPCDKKCLRKTEKILRCGHKQNAYCYQNTSEIVCQSPCRKLLECSHRCQATCGEACTVKCEENIIRVDWPCGHRVKSKCSNGPESCPQPCNMELSCGHMCKGTCGSCRRGRLHVFCKEKCGRILVCGHECRSTCAADCPPCREKCQNRCQHSKCKKQCGEPCVSCAERCTWNCAHVKCRTECGQPCNRRTCNQPCMLLLKCGHPCIGLCGEPCPKKCRVCHKDEVTEIFFGDEDEDDARFVELEDCGHVFEVNALDRWMKTDTGGDSSSLSIQLKECPRCKTTIRRNLRYGNVIKQALNDIEKVKEQTFGNKERIDINRRSLERQLILEVETMSMLAIAQSEKLFPTKEDGHRFLSTVSSSSLSFGQVRALENRTAFLRELRKIEKNVELLPRTTSKDKVIIVSMREGLADMRTWLCQGQLNRLSEQQAADANREAQRLTLSCKLLKILVQKPAAHEKAVAEVKQVKTYLFDGKAMTEEREKTIDHLLKEIVKKSGALGVSEEERKEIVAAIGLAKGHWYKCPRGHVYAIGDCGGANQGSKCPECGSAIGGQNHRLADGNVVASEMDGARYAAWSEQANMENFDLDELLRAEARPVLRGRLGLR